VKRRLFNVLAAVSLVLFVPAVVAWVLSYRWTMIAGFGDSLIPCQGVFVVAASGDVALLASRSETPFHFRHQHVRDHADLRTELEGADWHHRLGGFAVARSARGVTAPIYVLMLPLWSLALLLALAPGAWIYRAQSRRRRDRTGLCLVCGYDLRATPDRCPECGAIPRAACGVPQ
jgi:hypothetical protein